MKKLLGIILVVLMCVSVGRVYALGTTATGKQQIRLEAQEKRATIRANYITLSDLRNQLRADINSVRNLLKSYRDAGTLTQAQIDNAKSKLKAVRAARQAVTDEYGRVISIISQYKADKSEGKLTALDKIITLQEARKTMLQNAIDSFK